MIANLRILGKFFDPQILLGKRSGTFRDSDRSRNVQNTKHNKKKETNISEFIQKKLLLMFYMNSLIVYSPSNPGTIGRMSYC